MKRFIFFLLLSFPSLSFGQTFSFDLWHEGKLVMESGDTLTGAIKYNLDDLLEVRHDNHLESFTARKILLFEIFDQSYKRYRKFYSLPYSAQGGYKSPMFFEVLCEGKITLLSREKVELRNDYYSPYGYPFYSPFGYGGYGTRKVLINLYFILKETGDIEEVTDKRSSWMELMSSHADRVYDYAKANRLDFSKKYELKQIIYYYNSFFERK